MRFLADESCDFAVVRALRGASHDVLAVMEVARGAKDVVVLALAREERRVLRATLPAAVLDLVERFGERLRTSFIVLEPGRVRIGSMQPDEGSG